MTAQPQPGRAQPPSTATKQPTAQAPGRMALANVTRGKLKRSMRIFLYGVDKIGKSTFGAGAPAPIVIGAEDGTSELDVTRFPEPRSFQDILDALDQLLAEDHQFKTVVLDTADWAEPLIHRATCQRGDEKGKKPASIEGFGYGKGYVETLTEWRSMLSRLDALRSRKGMHIIILAHAWVKPFKNPLGDDFDRYEPKIHVKASALLKEWADCVLFAQHETGTVMKGDGPLAKARGLSSGARYIYTQRTAGYDAGNRYGLPPKLPLNWQGFEEAVKAGTPEDPAKLTALIHALAEQVDEATRERVTKWLATPDARDPIKLSQAADNLRGKISIKQDNAEDGTISKEEQSNQ